MATSQRLLDRAREGDSGALAALVARHLPGLRRWARGRLPRWVRTAGDTSDLVQDALVRTLSRLDAFEPRGHRALGAYLRTAVQNRILDEQRRARRWGPPGELPASLQEEGISPFDAALRAERLHRYREARATLSPADEALIVGYVELGYSHAQLACMTGRTPNAARMALCRAIERLATRMGQR